MSIKAMAMVWEHADVSGSELLVLLALADHGNDEGRKIFPSMAALAKKARLSAAQARRVIHKLALDGLIEIVEEGGFRRGRNYANEYRICMDRLLQGARYSQNDSTLQGDRGGTRASAGGGTRVDASTVLAPVQAQSSYNHHIQPSLEEKIAIAAQPPASPPSRKKDSHPMTHPILDAYVATLGKQYSVNYAKEGTAARALGKDGWQPEQVVACYEWLKRDPFWKNKHVGLQSVFQQIGAWHGKHGDSSTEDDSAEVERIRAEWRAADEARAAAATEAHPEGSRAAQSAAASVPVPDLPGHEMDGAPGQQWPSDNQRRFQPSDGEVRLPVQYRPSTFTGTSYPNRRSHTRRQS